MFQATSNFQIDATAIITKKSVFNALNPLIILNTFKRTPCFIWNI